MFWIYIYILFLVLLSWMLNSNSFIINLSSVLTYVCNKNTHTHFLKVLLYLHPTGLDNCFFQCCSFIKSLYKETGRRKSYWERSWVWSLLSPMEGCRHLFSALITLWFLSFLPFPTFSSSLSHYSLSLPLFKLLSSSSSSSKN